LQGQKAFRDGFVDFVRSLEREGKAGSYMARFEKVIRSWLSNYGPDVEIMPGMNFRFVSFRELARTAIGHPEENRT
jgi:hypothetical protein